MYLVMNGGMLNTLIKDLVLCRRPIFNSMKITKRSWLRNNDKSRKKSIKGWQRSEKQTKNAIARRNSKGGKMSRGGKMSSGVKLKKRGEDNKRRSHGELKRRIDESSRKKKSKDNWNRRREQSGQ